MYVALCYYKLDYYDVSQEVLAVYLQSIPDSTIALNLKACNHFRLYNGKAAEVSYTTTVCFLIHKMKVDDYDPKNNMNCNNMPFFFVPLDSLDRVEEPDGYLFQLVSVC